jgi:hypothetical protein
LADPSRDDGADAGALVVGAVVAEIAGLSAIALGISVLVGFLFFGWKTIHSRAYMLCVAAALLLFGAACCFAAIRMSARFWRRPVVWLIYRRECVPKSPAATSAGVTRSA